MNLRRKLLRRAARVAIVLALAPLCACALDQEAPGDPSFFRNLDTADAKVDAASAASIISGYRSSNGLSAVSVDPELMKLAEAQAQAMARADKLDHNVIRAFPDRLRGQGYRARNAAENIGAGHHTLAEAFSGWRNSPSHRANMLLEGATRMGIAAVYAPKSKYKVYWALILAAPDEARV